MATVIEKHAVLDPRFEILTEWLAEVMPEPLLSVSALAEDASFRRYFRVKTAEKSYVAMDAPPAKENCRPFVEVAQRFAHYKIQVPTIFAQDIRNGFLLLTDFGNCLYLDALADPAAADPLYRKAIASLHTIQTVVQAVAGDNGYHFPLFNSAYLMQEIRYFQEWCLEKHLFLTITETQQKLIHTTFHLLVKSAAAQPQVCVHRDYHSRNLLLLDDDTLGIIDFQDAMWGPVTYDLVSLLRDCYIAWPREQVEAWALEYYQQARETHLANYSAEQFLQWFDWMGVQRHLKAIFIFARKLRRDNNPAYLKEIPRTLAYVLDICQRYTELQPFGRYLQQEIAPLLKVNVTQ